MAKFEWRNEKWQNVESDERWWWQNEEWRMSGRRIGPSQLTVCTSFSSYLYHKAVRKFGPLLFFACQSQDLPVCRCQQYRSSVLLWASTSVEFDCAVLSAWSCSILYPSLYMMLSFLLSSVPLDDVANRLWGKISCRKNRAHLCGFTRRYYILKCYANFCMVKMQKWKQSKLN